MEGYFMKKFIKLLPLLGIALANNLFGMKHTIENLTYSNDNIEENKTKETKHTDKELPFFSKTFGVENTLVLKPNTEPQIIKLPFKYKAFSSKERDNVPFIYEFFYCTIDKDSKYKYVVVGPLQPCLLIALKNKRNGPVVIFHKQFSNSIDSLIKVTLKELVIQDPADITGVIFTKQMKNDSYLKTGWQAHHKNKTQEEEICHIKKAIINRLDIPDQNQISALIFESSIEDEDGEALGDYQFADVTVTIDAELNLMSTCMIRELFTDYDKYIEIKISTTRKHLQIKKLCKEGKIDQIDQYETIDFKKI